MSKTTETVAAPVFTDVAAAKAYADEHELEQIAAGDPRLADFWKAAHDNANTAGYCDVFNRIVRELGGMAPPTKVYETLRATRTYNSPLLEEPLTVEYTYEVFTFPGDAVAAFNRDNPTLDWETWSGEQLDRRKNDAVVRALNLQRRAKEEAELAEAIATLELVTAEEVATETPTETA